MNDIFEKLYSGELYLPLDERLVEEQKRCLDLLYDFNQTRPTEQDKREVLLRKMFAEIGKDCYKRCASKSAVVPAPC